MSSYSFDSSRAVFVQNEFRYDVRTDNTVKARYPAAIEVTLDTQLDAAAAATLATEYFTEFSKPASVYSVEIEDRFRLSDLAGGIPRYVVDDPAYPALAGKAMRVAGFTTDPVIGDSGRTELKVRG